MRKLGEGRMGTRVLAMWNTGKIDLALHSALPGMCAMSSFEVGLVSRALLTTSAFHGGPALGTLHGTRILESCTVLEYSACMQPRVQGRWKGDIPFFFFCFYSILSFH